MFIRLRLVLIVNLACYLVAYIGLVPSVRLQVHTVAM